MKIQGVERRVLDVERDPRGSLVEVFRQSWAPGFNPVQINVMRTVGGSLRGSHIHREHEDWLVIADGRALLGMKDVRTRSATFRKTSLIELSAAKPEAVRVPPGIIHGVYFPVDGILITVESLYHDPEEELKVKWWDPALGIAWPCETAQGPEADAYALDELMMKIEPWQRGWA